MSFLISRFHKYNYVFYILATCGLLVILYFSWIDSPRLSLSGVLPKFITNWTDKEENETLRTGVPFLFLSLVMGFKLFLNKASLYYWVLSFLSLTAIVCIAEVGQLFLPLRIFDLKDIFWGSVASLLGLLVMYFVSKLLHLKK